MSARQKIAKRGFDVLLSVFLLMLLILPIILLVLIAVVDTGEFGLYKQKRIGYKGEAFNVLKIRTIKGDKIPKIGESFSGTSKTGKFLQKTKLNELPQLINILTGDMSFVGPRPDVPGYADELVGEDRIILSIRPGLTGPATIKYRNEEVLLINEEDPERYNREVIWPDKVKINKEYIRNWSFGRDIYYLLTTFKRTSW
ncbi:sugar transferase [Leptobacterium flavescens]|uniref:Sugar transferase n=1 Tax=Leptobacterium flavescens TaxID=472055 RepID=A0A6P0UJX7_9FLAO|nr:sugar transferase [Leptobacterium flavescens]